MTDVHLQRAERLVAHKVEHRSPDHAKVLQYDVQRSAERRKEDKEYTRSNIIMYREVRDFQQTNKPMSLVHSQV